jgi:hypothetical protein
MLGPSPRLVLLAVIAACGPSGSLPDTGSEPGTASTTADDSPPVTTTSTGETTTGTGDGTTQSRPTTGDGDATTQSDPTTGDISGTTQSRTTTGLTEPVDTTAPDSSGTDTTTTGETGDGTTSTTTSDSTTSDIPDTTGGELCEGVPDEADLTWSLEVPPALANQNIAGSCQVVSADDMGQAVAVHLSCAVEGDVEDLVLHYSLTPERDLVWAPGASATLTYRTEPAAWNREWLTLQTELTRLWAVRADALAPPGVDSEEYYGRPITTVAACDPQPDPCGQRQGLEVRISHDIGDIPTFLAVQSGQWGIYGFPVPTIVWLEHASHLLDPNGCDDVAPLQLDMLLVDDASGF